MNLIPLVSLSLSTSLTNVSPLQEMSEGDKIGWANYRQLQNRPIVKGMLKTSVFSVTETCHGVTWTIWRNNRTKEWAASNGIVKILNNSITLKNLRWRKLQPTDPRGTFAIGTFYDYIVWNKLPYARGGYPDRDGSFRWKSKRVPALTIFWVYGEPMQGSTSILCDARTGAPREITEENWGVSLEAKEETTLTKVLLGDIKLDATWPKWAE